MTRNDENKLVLNLREQRTQQDSRGGAEQLREVERDPRAVTQRLSPTNNRDF